MFRRVADDPRLRLVVAGDGPDRPVLTALAKQNDLDDRIIFLGEIAHPEEVLPSFDIFALSSDTEQIPNAILEAMAAGLPVVAVDVGDVRMMVAPENQPFVVPRDDLDSFAAAARQLVNDAGLRRHLGIRNRHQVTSFFRQELMFSQYEELFLKFRSKNIQ